MTDQTIGRPHGSEGSAGRHAYHTVQPRELGAKFPSPMGITTRGPIGTVRMVVVRSDRGVALQVEHDPYDPRVHSSMGVGAGRYPLETGTMDSKGAWMRGPLDKYLRDPSVTWRNQQPTAGGAYPVDLLVSAELADVVKAREYEHVRDFDYAWDRSIGLLAATAAALPAAADQEVATGALVDRLIADQAAYLVPSVPEDLEAWAARVREVYAALCDQSGRRDTAGEHGPSQRFLSFDPHSKRVTVDFIAGPPHPDSAAYIRPADIPRVFTAPGYQAYRSGAATAAPTQAPFKVGDRVRWAAAGELSKDDERVFPQPEVKKPQPEPIEARYQIQKVGGDVVDIRQGLEGDWLVWVRISLLEEPIEDEAPPRTSAGEKLGQDHGFLYLLAKDLAVVRQ